MQIDPLSRFSPEEIQEFIRKGAPYVVARSLSDYWMYARFFNNTCLVATKNDKICALLIAYQNQSERSELYIQDILVSPEQQKQGLCRQLLQSLEERALKLKVKKIWLTSEFTNSSCKVWPKLGFRNPIADEEANGLHISKNLKGIGKDRIIFEKKIGV